MADLLQPGAIFHNYTITRLVGRGGMGEVYEASETNIGRKVALKVIPNRTDAEGMAAIQRFLVEAQTLALVSHPNVVTLFNMGQHDNLHYIAMEFVEGISLRGLLNSYVLSAQEAATLGVQILQGLEAFHQQNIIHRDISPRNIIVRPNGTIKIIDLGIAKQVGQHDLTSTGMVVGTLSYMAPEIVYGLPATVRTDLWATGALLFEATSGQALTANQNSLNSAEYPPECQNWVPAPFRRIVAKLCANKPEDRHTSATEAAEELNKLSNGKHELGRPSLAALARTIDNIAEVEKSLQQASVTGLTAKRALTLAAQMSQSKVLPVSGGNRDMTEVLRHDTTVRIEAQAVTRAIAQVRNTVPRPAGASPGATTQQHFVAPIQAPQRRVNWAVILLVSAVVCGAGYVQWKNKREAAAKAAAVAAAAAEAAAKAARAAIKYTPTSPQQFWLKPGEAPQVTWTPKLAGPAQLEIAPTREFAAVQRFPAQETSAAVGAALTEGKYFWRLTGDDVNAGPFEFQLSTIAAPVPLEPAAGAKFEFGSKENQYLADFTWQCKMGGQIYRVQVSRNQTFTDVINEGQSRTCDWKGIGIPAGTYFWRVRTDQPVQAQVWSDIREFTVSRAIAQTLAAAPAKPEASKMLANLGTSSDASSGSQRSVEANRQPAAAPAPFNPPSLNTPANGARHSRSDAIDVTWGAVNEARGYTLEFAADQNFTAPVSRKTSTPGFQFQNKWLKADRIYWRVRAEGRLISDWSEVRYFNVD